MELYAAFDLHANNCYLGVVEENGKRIYRRKLRNDPKLILGNMERFQDDLVNVVVESTYNWYWLVDLLMDEGYTVHLANPSAIQKYSGLKHCDDDDDAFWLAEMSRLQILPKGYIYPKEVRPVRDLLRKRSHLVRIRSSLANSMQNIVVRNSGKKLRVHEIRRIEHEDVLAVLDGDPELSMAAWTSKEAIDFVDDKIRSIEIHVEKKLQLQPPYKQLLTIPGVGKILGSTIMLETGPIERFAKVGNYVSYCRKVPSKWTSNGKTKGAGNRKNGNKYLAWAFSEAAEIGRRYNKAMADFFNRKTQKANRMVGHGALAHKLARAAYYIMRDQVAFQADKLFRS